MTEKPDLLERFADNGEHSHWELRGRFGILIWTEDEDEKEPIGFTGDHCKSCNGSGYGVIPDTPCLDCDGNGKISTPTTLERRVTDEEIKEGDWVTGEFLGETFIRKVVKYYGNIRTQLLNGSQPSGNLVEPPQYWTYSGERYQQLSNCKKTKSNIGNSIALRNELESFAKSIYPNDYKREDAFITGADWERDRLSQSPVRGEEEIKKNTKPFDAGSPDNYKRA